jgi:cytochrome P450
LNLPPGIRVNPNILSVQCHPRYWGTDSLQWRPSRWIVSPSTSKLEINPLEHESIYKPPDGCYIPFAEGTRSCPGRKFAQVEHVAVMASLFRAHRVQPVLRAGESMKQASKRIMDVIDDRGMKLLMQMLHPENAVLEWQKC